MTDARMQIIIDGNSTGAVNATQKASGAFSNLMKIFGVGVLAGGGIALAQKSFQMLEQGIQTAINSIQESITAAADAEMQLTKLNTALKATGNFTQEVSNELVEYAESLQNVTAYEDDAIISVEAMLATFKLSKDEIKIATQATLDLAAATGQDLQSAAILMGKAMVGETGTLKRYGIMVDENKLKTQGWRAVIDEINTEFGGQALAQGETYTGMLERMKNQIGNLKETIGSAFLPVLKDMMGRFEKGGGFEKLQEWAGKAAAKIKEFLDALMGADWSSVITAVKDLGGTLNILITGDSSFATAEEKAQNFADTLAEVVNMVARLATGLKLLSEAVILSWRSFDLFGQYFSKGFVERLQTDWDAWLETFQRGISETNLLINGFGNTATHSMDGYMESSRWATDATNTLKEAVGGLANDTDTAAIKTDDLVKKLDLLSPSEVLAEDKTGQLKKVLKQMADVTLESVGQAIALKRAIDALESKTITITTMYLSREAYYSGKDNTGKVLKGAQQSGGLIKNDTFSTDLNIPLVKGEAVIPAYLVNAIKQGRSSFASLDTGGGGSVQNYFNISGLVVREEADVERIAKDLYNLQTSALRGAGIR